MEVAFLAAHLMGMTTFDDMRLLYDLVTTSAAKALGLRKHGLAVGNNADLVVLNAKSEWQAIWNHEAPGRVIRKGRNITLPQRPG